MKSKPRSLPRAHLPVFLLLWLLLWTAARGEPLDRRTVPALKSVAALDDTLQVLAYDHFPAWYWPGLDSLGATVWWVDFTAPADLELVGCLVATYGGAGDSCTVSVESTGSTLAQVHTALDGYSLEDYQEIFLPAAVSLSAGAEFKLEITYDGFFGPPFLTADDDGSGSGRSHFRNGGETYDLTERDLCLRALVRFSGGGDPLPPVITLSADNRLRWEAAAQRRFSARVLDPSGVASVYWHLRAAGQETAVLPMTEIRSNLWTVTPDSSLLGAPEETSCFVEALDILGQASFSDTLELFPASLELSTPADFSDLFVAPGVLPQDRDMLAVRFQVDLEGVLSFLPAGVRMLGRGRQPLRVFVVADNGGRPSWDYAPDGNPEFRCSLAASSDSTDLQRSDQPGWWNLQLSAADTACAFDTLLTGDYFWVVALYEGAYGSAARRNAFACDTTGGGGHTYYFDRNSWEFEPLAAGDVLWRVQGTSFSCDDLYRDHPLYESFEEQHLPPCWSNLHDDSTSFGWRFGTTFSTFFQPQEGDGFYYAYINTDEPGYTEYSPQDTLLTPGVGLQGASRLAFKSFLRVEDFEVSARVIWRRNQEPFQVLGEVVQEAMDSTGHFAFRTESFSIPTTDQRELYQFGFVFHSQPNAYGWAVDSVTAAMDSAAVLFRWEGPLVGTCQLAGPYPNPFNSRVTIPYRLREPARVEISIYNLAGRRVEVLKRETQEPGEFTVSWEAGPDLASGVYFLELKARAVNAPAAVQRQLEKLLFVK